MTTKILPSLLYIATLAASALSTGCATIPAPEKLGPPAQETQQLPKPATQSERVLLALQAQNPGKSAAWVLDQFTLYLMLKN